MEYLKKAKEMLPIQSLLSRFQPLQPIKITQKPDQQSDILRVFINSEQNYVITVTSYRIEVHDLKSNKLVSSHDSNDQFITADFTKNSEYGTILAICQTDQNVIIFEPNELLKLKTMNVGESKVTCMNCELGKLMIVGYENGLAKIFHIKSSKEECELDPVQSYEINMNNDKFSAVNHIRVSQKQKLAFIAHEDYIITNGSEQKLQHTPIHIFNYESGELQNDYQIPNVSINSMEYLESRNSLILLSNGQHKIYIINTLKEGLMLQVSTDFENITDTCLLNSMLLCPITKTFLSEKYVFVSEFNDECMLIFTLSNGTILSGILRFYPQESIDESYESCHLLPLHLYNSNQDPAQVEKVAIQSLTYDINQDAIVYVDSKFQVSQQRGVFASIVSTISPSYKAVEYEDPKQLPFFSLRPYKKKNHEEQNKPNPGKDQLPLFSLQPNLSEISSVINFSLPRNVFHSSEQKQNNHQKLQPEKYLELADLQPKQDNQEDSQDKDEGKFDIENPLASNQLDSDEKSVNQSSSESHNRIYILE